VNLTRLVLLVTALLLLAACEPQKRERTPEEVRAALLRKLPPKLADRGGWAEDIRVSFAALKVRPSDENLCAALAVTEQESGYVADRSCPDWRASPRRRSSTARAPTACPNSPCALRSNWIRPTARHTRSAWRRCAPSAS
jgi:hypothetical protein